MSENRQGWEALLAQLETRTASAHAMGGEERIARQHTRGRQTARERIAQLCDAGSFNELGALAGGCHPAGTVPVPADALVGGIARLEGRSVVVIAEDFTVKGGSIGHPNSAKRTRLVMLAQEQKIPLVLMLDGAGERASNALERYPHAPGDLQLLADIQGKVPVVSLILGTSAGHGALTGMFADLIIITAGSALFTAGPPLVEAAMGIKTTAEELGGARMHTSTSGVVHNLAEDEAQAFAMTRHFLAMLPTHRGAALPTNTASVAAQAYELDSLLDIIPPVVNTPYDMRKVLAALADDSAVFELQPAYGASMLTALVRVGGIPCLLVANQPAVMAGAITTAAAEKAAHFIGVADSFGLPVIFLLDNPGVMSGPAAEQTGVLRAAGKMFAAQRRLQSLKIVVTLRKAFGFGSSVMGMNPFDHQAISLALPGVTLGGVPAISGAAAAKASAEDAATMKNIQSGVWVPADAMAFDKVIDPRQLRHEIIAALHRALPRSS